MNFISRTSQPGLARRKAAMPGLVRGFTQPRAGFTLIEILLALSIILIIMVITISVFSNFRKAALLNSAVELVVSAIDGARMNTLASAGGSRYGVHFESSRVVLFKGLTYVEGDPAASESKLPDQVKISTISLAGGGMDLVFARLTGATSQFGSVVLALKADPNNIKTISIFQTGIIQVQ